MRVRPATVIVAVSLLLAGCAVWPAGKVDLDNDLSDHRQPTSAPGEAGTVAPAFSENQTTGQSSPSGVQPAEEPALLTAIAAAAWQADTVLRGLPEAESTYRDWECSDE